MFDRDVERAFSSIMCVASVVVVDRSVSNQMCEGSVCSRTERESVRRNSRELTSSLHRINHRFDLRLDQGRDHIVNVINETSLQ